MADTRINALATTAAATAADDYFVIDGTTNGTRKHTAYTPVFSTVTASGSMSITGATGSLTLGAATETLAIAVTAAGAGTITAKSGQVVTIANNVALSGATSSITLGAATETLTIAVAGTGSGTITPKSGQSLTLASAVTASGIITASTGIVIGAGSFAEAKLYKTATGGLTIAATTGSSYDLYLAAPDGNPILSVATGGKDVLLSATTASTSTSTGALVVSGGVGVAGNIVQGGYHRFTANATLPGQGSIAKEAVYGLSMYAATGSTYDFLIFNASGSGLFSNATGTSNLKAWGDFQISGTTASNDTSTGALVVSGGVGVAKEINAGTGSANVYTIRASGSGGTNLCAIGGGAVASLQGFTDAFAAATLQINQNGGAVNIGSTSTVTTLLGTTDSTDKDTGALVVDGGVGVEKALTVGTTLGVGTGAVANALVYAIKTLSGSAAQYGAYVTPTGSSAATTSITGAFIKAASDAAAFTSTDVYGVVVGATVKGAGSTITNNYGLYVEQQTVGGTLNYAIYTNAGLIKLGDTTDATDKDTAAVVLEGGLAVEKKIITGSSIQTGTPNGGTAGAWKTGIRVAATTALDTTQYIQLDVGGTLYKLAVVTV